MMDGAAGGNALLAFCTLDTRAGLSSKNLRMKKRLREQ